MNQRILNLLIVPVLLLSFASCTITRQSLPQASINAQVELGMEDLEFVGLAEGKSVQKYVLGLPIGGRRYTSGYAAFQTGLPIPGIPATRGMNNAMYDALQTVPGADFILPVSVTSTRDVDFLGSTVTLTVKGKAFKIKETE